MLIIIIEMIMIDVRVKCLVVKTKEAAKKKDTSQKNHLKKNTAMKYDKDTRIA